MEKTLREELDREWTDHQILLAATTHLSTILHKQNPIAKEDACSPYGGVERVKELHDEVRHRGYTVATRIMAMKAYLGVD